MSEQEEREVQAALQRLREQGRLPSPGEVARQIQALSLRDDVSTAEIAACVSQDPVLTGRLLKFANSPAIGFSRPVVAIQDALVLLGIGVVRQLAIGLSVMADNMGGPCQAFDYPRFWSESLATGVTAQALCAPGLAFSAEEVFSTGLLSGVGRLALAALEPETYGELLNAGDDATLPQRERDAFGLDHLMLTTALLREWGLPEVHVEGVRLHEQPPEMEESDSARTQLLAHLLNTARLAARLFMSEEEDREPLLSRVLAAAGILGYEPDAVAVLLEEAAAQWQDWGRVVDVPTRSPRSFMPSPEDMESDAEEARRQAERAMRQAQKMQAIGRITGGVAHDFNNMLAAILGYAELALERNQARYGDDKLENYLQQIQRTGQRAQERIAQMLAFSHGSGQEPRWVEPGPVLREIMASIEHLMPSGIQVQFQAEPDLPKVLMDPAAMEQAITNLCLNARDAMGQSGTLLVRVCRVSALNRSCVSCEGPIDGDFLEIAVSDTGGGIPPQHVRRIFEPFFTTRPQGEASGMGLAVVHGIVHKLGGHILLENVLGAGVTFRLFLPLEPDQSSRQDAETAGRSQ